MTSYKKKVHHQFKSPHTRQQNNPLYNAQLESSSNNLDISSTCNSDICHQVMYPWTVCTNIFWILLKSAYLFYESLFIYKWLFIFISLGKPIFLSWSFIDFRFQCYVLYNLMHEISTAQHIKNSHFIHSSSQVIALNLNLNTQIHSHKNNINAYIHVQHVDTMRFPWDRSII
jgi:hypothetical protein